MINASKWRTEVSVQTGSQNLKYVHFSHVIYFKYTSSKNFIIIMSHSLGLLQLKSENDNKEEHQRLQGGMKEKTTRILKRKVTIAQH